MRLNKISRKKQREKIDSVLLIYLICINWWYKITELLSTIVITVKED